MDGTDELLDLHLHEEHAAKLEPIVAHMLRADAPDAMSSVYKEAARQYMPEDMCPQVQTGSKFMSSRI